jgi:hypothetical protein
MSNAPTKTAPPTTTTVPEKAPAQTSPLRVGILLGVLVLVVGLMGYDFMIAKPATEQAYKDVEQLSNERNAKGVTKEGKIDAQLLKPADIQAKLNKKPSSTKQEKDYYVEYYWWGGMPHRNYISVLYYGTGENLRFNTHYQNAAPNPEDLPNAKLPEGPPTVSNDAPETTDGKEKGPPLPETPSTDKPADEAPSSDKPAADKPADDKPAAEKSADE